MAGGKTVALMLGGRQVAGTSRDQNAGSSTSSRRWPSPPACPCPPVYLLPEKRHQRLRRRARPGDAVVAVSQGCLGT